MAVDQQNTYYHATIDFPYHDSKLNTMIHVFNVIESVIEYLESRALPVESSSLYHELREHSGIFDGNFVMTDASGAETECEVSRIVAGMRYPEDYRGELDFDEQSCLISIAEVGSGTPAVPEYWACDYDFYPKEEAPEDSSYPCDRWHISICTKAMRDALRLRLHITYYLFSREGDDNYFISDSQYIMDGAFDRLFKPLNGRRPHVGNALVFDRALSLDYTNMPNSKATRDQPDLVELDMVDASRQAIVSEVPVPMQDVMRMAFSGFELSSNDIVEEFSATRWLLFENMLRDTNRTLPVVLVCSTRDGKWPVSRLELMSRVVGMADVFYADITDPRVNKRLNLLFRRRGPEYNFRCRPGFVKVYPGGIDITNAEDSRKCFAYQEDDIYDFFRFNFQDDMPVANDLAMRQPAMEGTFRNVAALARSRADAAFGAFINAVENLGTIDPDEALSYQSTIVNDASLIVEIREYRDWAGMLDAENVRLATEINGVKRTLEKVEHGRSVLQERYDDLFQTHDECRRNAERLEAGQQILEAIDRKLPTKVDDVLTLIEEVYPERVVVLPEAHVSASKVGARNLDSAWRILRYIPTTLWSFCFEGEGMDIEREFESQTGYPLALTETGSTKNDRELMRRRRIEHDGKAYDFVAHIKGGTRKDPFRVYYAVDSERRAIVIGHCGEHLLVSSSKR